MPQKSNANSIIKDSFKQLDKQNDKKKDLEKIDKVLSKVLNVDNDKVDALRLLRLYIDSDGSDINLNRLVKFLKED